MKVLRQIFLNSPEDCDWLRTTHLKHTTPPAFLSFGLDGNEDAPVNVRLYANRKPEYNEKPIAVYHQDTHGDLRREGEVKPVIRRRRAGHPVSA